MATIQNERDKLLQAAPIRFILPTIPTSQVDGLDGWMGDVNDALGTLGEDIEHLMNTSSSFSISASALTFTTASGATTPPIITLTAHRGDGLVGGTVAWSVFGGAASISPTVGNNCVVTGSTVTGNSVTIRARLTIGGQVHDAYVTLTRLGAIARSDLVSLTSQITGQLANSNVSGLGALALLNAVDLNTQTTGALNGLTQVNNLGNLAYVNALAANQIGAGTLAVGIVYAGGINATQVNSGSFVGKTFTGGTFTGGTFTSQATGRRTVIDSDDISFYPASGGRSIIASVPGGGLTISTSSSGSNLSVSANSFSSPGITVASPGNVGIQISAGDAALRLNQVPNLPASRAAGGVCFYAGWLCFANGSHWYRSDGTQLT
ncbi:MAG: hypothetical protein M0P09_01245 [Acholeplasmataceae bacterium]|nr:hypothetical protein [Acholeplasmataceae bacterium]